MPKILVIHGPTLNLLGVRQKSIYGNESLARINRELRKLGRQEKVTVSFYQSNSEGAIVNKLQQARRRFDAILINPAAFTHTSVAIRDAAAAIEIPVIEVHLSNIQAREEFRRQSYLSPVASGVIFGFGIESYLLGLRGAIALLRAKKGRADV